MTKSKFPKFTLPTLCLLPFLAVIFLHIDGLLSLAHADDGGGLGASVILLFNAIKDHASTAVVVMFVFKILTSHETYGVLGKIGLQGKTLQIVIAILTTLGFCADAWAKGSSIPQALIEGFFTAGGAMLIYDASKTQTAQVANAAVAPVAAMAMETAQAVEAKKD